MIVCPNGCKVLPDAIAHFCRVHTHHNLQGESYVCKIKNCQLKTPQPKK